MLYNIIVCCDKKYGIGKTNAIPWTNSYLGKLDIKYFYKTTTQDNSINNISGIVIMGSKTWFSIPKNNRPLKKRINIIISKKIKSILNLENTYVFSSIEESHKWIINQKEYKSITKWIIGGAQIYKEYLKRNWIKKIILTKLDKCYYCDVKFPEQMLSNFTVFSSISYSEKLLPMPYSIIKYKYDNKEENNFLKLLKNIMEHGYERPDRTNTGTISLFGNILKYTMHTHNISINGNVEESFTLPMLTTKHVWFRGIFEELMWFLNGQTDSKILENKGINIWKKNSSRKALDNLGLNYQEGENGPIYGKQWRNWNGIDQIKNIIKGLKKDPFSRRHILNSWNVSELDKMSVPPCHVIYQFYVNRGKDISDNLFQKDISDNLFQKDISDNLYLSCMMFQRSGDMFLGVPFNLTSVSLLTLLIATQVNMKPYQIIHTIGDAHIYGSKSDILYQAESNMDNKYIVHENSHIKQVYEQLLRNPYPFPRIRIINKINKIEDYKIEDLKLINYTSHKKIYGKMAV